MFSPLASLWLDCPGSRVNGCQSAKAGRVGGSQDKSISSLFFLGNTHAVSHSGCSNVVPVSNVALRSQQLLLVSDGEHFFHLFVGYLYSSENCQGPLPILQLD